MTITSVEQKVLDLINRERLLNLTLNLVEIPSYTGQEKEIAEFYADYLRQLGLEVSLDYEYSNSPTVAAWLRGTDEGPTIQLNGHLDTIPLEHDPPCYKDGRVYGRGSCDQKAGVAGMTEAVQAIIESGVLLKGNILLTATGMHERPGAFKDSIISLARKGPLGDAILITEGPADEGVPIVQKGLVIFEIIISRPGTPIHEARVQPGDANPLWAGWRMMQLLKTRSIELQNAGSQHRCLEPDSLFVGAFEAGDFFNVLPTTCRIWGTRRWSPGIDYEHVVGELDQFARQVEDETSAHVKVNLDLVGYPSEIKENEPIVSIVQNAHEDLTNKSLPVIGMIGAGDAWIFNNIGKRPTTYYTGDTSRAHATPEYVVFEKVVQATSVYALTALRYVGYHAE